MTDEHRTMPAARSLSALDGLHAGYRLARPGTGRARLTPVTGNRRTRDTGRRLLGSLALATLAGCAGVAPAPIADRPIHLDARCEQRDINDFREQARLSVTDGTVRALSWQLWVGNRGTCRFELADFRQVQSRPHVELLARDGSACKLMIWQDGRRVTLGHAGCERRCSPGIADDAWPVMFDPRTGSCAPVQ